MGLRARGRVALTGAGACHAGGISGGMLGGRSGLLPLPTIPFDRHGSGLGGEEAHEYRPSDEVTKPLLS